MERICTGENPLTQSQQKLLGVLAHASPLQLSNSFTVLLPTFDIPFFASLSFGQLKHVSNDLGGIL